MNISSFLIKKCVTLFISLLGSFWDSWCILWGIDFSHFPNLDNLLNQPSGRPKMCGIVKEISYPVTGLFLATYFSLWNLFALTLSCIWSLGIFQGSRLCVKLIFSVQIRLQNVNQWQITEQNLLAKYQQQLHRIPHQLPRQYPTLLQHLLWSL